VGMYWCLKLESNVTCVVSLYVLRSYFLCRSLGVSYCILQADFVTVPKKCGFKILKIHCKHPRQLHNQFHVVENEI